MTYFPQINALPDAIFWDWDGTIVDSYNLLNETHNYTLRTLNMNELEEGAFRHYFGRERMYVFANLYGDQMDNAIEIFQDSVIKNSHKILPIKGIEAVMDLLQNNKVILGLVTNKRRCFVEKELTHTGLAKFLPIVVCAAEAEHDKPFADPLLKAIAQASMSAKKHEIWYVGDTETDIKCATNAGCKSIFIEGHKDTERILKEYFPYISFDNYYEFKDFLVAI
jgi:phosphoglycolate phosphatase